MSELTQKKVNVRPLVCTVVSDKMSLSRVGEIESRVLHPTAHKHIKRTTRLMFHDAKNETQVGDKVLVSPCRPMSARKRFVLVEVIAKSKGRADVIAE